MSLNSGESFPRKLFDPCDKIPHFEIDGPMRRALCFRENLIVTLKDELTTNTKPVGGYCLSVESIGKEGNEFMIQMLSSLTVNDSFAGSKVLGSSTDNFHCLEEKRTELALFSKYSEQSLNLPFMALRSTFDRYIYQHDGLQEKVLFIGLEEDFFHVEAQEICPCDKSVNRKDLPLCSSGEMISEATNVLLMRYLALRNFHGSLSFQSIMISGQLTTSNYRCTGAQRMKLNGKVLPVYTIERRMHEECGLIHNTKTYMTQSGYILRHDWLEIPYLVQINSLIDPNDLVNKDQNIVTPLRSRWRSDIQMMSMYLDKKTCQMAQQTEYLTDHPEIKQLISDFTQTLLAGNHLATKATFLPSFLRQPVNVLSFTVQHFAAFAKNPDLSKVGPSGESNLDMSQLSTYKPRRVCSVCGICFECLMSEQPPNNVERKRTTRGSKSPAFSTCSVFTKCPSDAICVRKLSDGSDPSVTCSDDCRTCEPGEKHTSICNLHPECLLTCGGCQHEREPCQVHKDCPECLGCRKVCSFYPQCKKTCEGCRIVKEPCRVHKDCPECPGCRNLCSFHPECEKTCDGCRMTEEKPCNVDKDCNECPGCLSKICSFHPECEETCEGCQPVKEPCRVHKACPECPGCHEVCSEIGVCSNCVKCNIEILPESAKVVFNLDSEN